MCLYCLRRAAHLTNDAVQKTRDTYHAHEDHCKMGMPALAQELGLDLQGKVGRHGGSEGCGCLACGGI